ncbi:MAG: hypothetical protein E4G90_09505 [Gemmatimonadales bacterium]|nr:MAG: hypothetical protein E4G90_09505 [Gemmatimonadales bacterium]
MGDMSTVRRNITNVCRYVGLVERGDVRGADELLRSLTTEELHGAFNTLAGGYSGLGALLGMDMSRIDEPENVEALVERTEWAIRVVKGRMGFN